MQRFNYAVIDIATGKTVAMCAKRKDADELLYALDCVYGSQFRIEEKIIEPRHRATKTP